MAELSHRSGSKNWTRGIFATFWILLAGISGYYLFTLFTNPSALGGQSARVSEAPAESAAPAPQAPSITPDQAVALLEADKTHDSDLGEIKSSLTALSEQLADLNTRLEPIEKFVGPVAALPSAASVTTSPPTPGALPVEPPASAPAAAPPPPAAEPAATPEAETPAPMAEPEVLPPPPTRVSRPAPAPAAEAATPPEPAPEPATPEVAAEPEPVAEEPAPSAEAPAPVEEAAADVAEPEPAASDAPEVEEAPATVEAAEPEPAQPPDDDDVASAATSAPESAPASEQSTPPPPQGMETAALDPVTLPPAANDGTTRYGIEIGIAERQDGLRPLWREFLTNHAALVAGLQPRRVLAPDKKWRLIAGPFANAQEAAAACNLFKKADRPCAATVYAGDAL